MTPNVRRELIPRDDALDLIRAFNALKEEAHTAAHTWELLNEDGQVPAAPPYTVLLQHAAGAQDLSRGILRITSDFAHSPHHTTRVGSNVLAKLAWATTTSSNAAPQFAETAEYALSLPRSTSPADRNHITTKMVFSHATGRAHLRRTSASLRMAAEQLADHLGFQRFLTQLTPQEGPPTPPPPRPSSRNR
ncbi:hypothetical protein [Streptomyces microflavus]